MASEDADAVSAKEPGGNQNGIPKLGVPSPGCMGRIMGAFGGADCMPGSDGVGIVTWTEGRFSSAKAWGGRGGSPARGSATPPSMGRVGAYRAVQITWSCVAFFGQRAKRASNLGRLRPAAEPP